MKVRALNDIWTFFDMINYQGGRERFSQCHFDAVDWYLGSKDAGINRQLILMPRGHLKSTIFSVGRVLWRIYQNPNIRIFVGTATKALATMFVREIKQYLEDPWLQQHVWNNRPHVQGKLIPSMDRTGRSRRDDTREEDGSGDYTEAEDKKVVWRADAIQVLRPYTLKEPTVMVGSVGSQSTGAHYDELQLDDVVTYDNINTPDKRERLFSWIYDLESVLDPEYEDEWLEESLGAVNKSATRWATVGGVSCVVGTRYDLEDYYQTIIDNQEDLEYQVYQKNIYANGEDNSEGYLWPEKWNEKLERKTRKGMTPTRFASQYLNRILAPEDQVLKLEKVNFIHPSFITLQANGNVLIKNKVLDKDVVLRPILVVDPAAALGADSDFTAMCVGGRDELGNLYVLDLKVGRWTSEQIIDNTYKLLDKYGLKMASIESVGGFKHLVQAYRMNFQKYYPITLIEFRPQGSKEMRISNALQPLFENGMVFMPIYLGSVNEVVNQLQFFPRKTMHDDVPDVIAALSELAKKQGKKPKTKLPTNRRYGGIYA